MKTLIFLIRNYKFDLLTALFALVLYFVSFQFSSEPRTILLFSLLITILSLGLIVYLRLRDRDFYFIPLEKRQNKDDWIGRGIFEYRRTSKSFLITEADPGYIFSKTLNWSDYKFESEFKILNKGLGVIVRAINLSDYIMFQICPNGIRPHIRINGGWQVWEAKEVNLEFKKKLSFDKWYLCSITCEKDYINIKISEDEKVLLQRSWVIPHQRFGFPFPQQENDPKPLLIHFPINLDYGTVGFRNSGDERALIKNVLIEKV